jgi:predicted AAA+ superfamily ATPase
MATLKPWRQVVTPHADIRQGKFDASVFAADLGEVLAGRGAVDYQDAMTFFTKTYLTDGLSKLVIDVIGRLAGTSKTDPVIQLQTAFGGGKTHTLLTLYHLLKKPTEAGKLPQIQALVHAAGLKQIPAASVACLVGTALNPTSSRTFWGEMAWQLGGERLYQRMAKSDEQKVSPGTDLLGQLLADAGPCLILLDEILIYLVRAGGIRTAESTLRGNTLSFLQELSIAVANCPHAVMIATLTSQIGEYMDENAERTYESLEKVLGRIEKVRNTVEGTEIYEVIRRRLFEDLGDTAHHKAAAQAFWEMYRGQGEDVPGGCRESSYRTEIERAYPFHPELISVLYERWGTIPEFQRTRGVLRLLADVISNLYQAKDNEALIASGSINLGSSAVRGELVKHTGSGNVFHSVIESDIAGSHAKAPEIDRQLGSEYAKESVSEKLARAIFMYSFSGSQQRGATLPQLRAAVLNPEMAPPFVSDALDRMTKRLWYLYQDSGLYRFDARPNLNRILVDREEMIRSEPGKVRDFAKNTLNGLIGDVAFRVYRYPEPDDDSFVGDEPRLSLVVLDLEFCATEEGLPKETEALVARILKQHGKGFRKHANMLVFLAPDQHRASDLTDAARRLLALRSIDEHKGTKAQLTDEQSKDLAGRLKEAEARLPAALMNTYRHILVPAEKKTIRVIDLGIAVGKAALSQKVLDKLKDEQQILEKLDPAILIGPRFGLWPDDQETVNVRVLADYFTQLTHLPRLLNSEVLPECISKGVQRGLFAYALGDGEKRQFDTILFADKQATTGQCEVTDSAWLVRPALAKSLLPEPDKTSSATGSEVEERDASTGSAASGPAASEDWSTGGGVKIVQGERRLSRVRVAMNVPWENWNDIYNEVIDPLAKEGADVRCEVVIIAKGDAAIRENTVELGIRESLGQRGIQADIQMG